MSSAFKENRKNGLVFMSAETISAKHAFTTRWGGVSAGEFESLNLGEGRGDEPERVIENYRRLGDALDIDPGAIAIARQVHGNSILIAGEGDRHERFAPVPHEADGLVTDRPGLTLAVFTADCAPLLMYDARRGVAAAVHCGWRGTVLDIAGRALEAMEKLGARPRDIGAAIGPAIGKCCFEVGPEVAAALEDFLGGAAEGLCLPCAGKDKFMVDIKEANRRRLAALGVPERSIAVSDECTRCRRDKYWSHRATNGRRGSQAALITAG